jgi:hypothetical protein
MQEAGFHTLVFLRQAPPCVFISAVYRAFRSSELVRQRDCPQQGLVLQAQQRPRFISYGQNCAEAYKIKITLF